MINTKIKNFIKNHAIKDSPFECCGFVVEHKSNFFCIPVKNIAKDKENDFRISTQDFLNIKSNFNILYIYHSHPQDNFDFSNSDKISADRLQINYILYCCKNNEFKIYEANTFKNKYIGRFYEYRKYDCFTLIRDYYLNELNQNLDINYTESIIDIDVKQYFIDNYKNKNLRMISANEKIKENDILLIDGIRNNSHCALYLGNNKILHQPMFSFSKIENYCNFHRRHTDLVFRSKIYG